MNKKFIVVRWQFAGFHAYENAPEQVSFLKTTHRHLFKCSAKIEVKHDNRELEFFMVQTDLTNVFKAGNHDNKSCEMIAENILSYIENRYGYDRKIEIEVSEDGENSAVVENAL